MKAKKVIFKILKILPILLLLYYRIFYRQVLFSLSFLEIICEVVAVLIFGYLWIELVRTFQDTVESILKYRKNRSSKQVRKEVKIRLTYYLPCEIFLSGITILFAFGVYQWAISNILVISVSSLLFKKVNYDVPRFLISSILGVNFEKLKFPEDEFIKNANMLPNDFYSSIYIPQQAKNFNAVISGIRQGFRAYKNNLNSDVNKDYLAYIYHSDTADSSFRRQEIREIFDIKENNNRVFMLARNQEAKNPMFLRKPGGYMSDYQILSEGIWHPVTYVSKYCDGRRQYRVKTDKHGKIKEMKEHMPFTVPVDSQGHLVEEEDYDYYIKYRGSFIKHNLYVKEKFGLVKFKETGIGNREGAQKDVFKNKRDIKVRYDNIKIRTLSYLIDMEDPDNRIRLVSGDLFDLNGKLLAKSYQWQIDNNGFLTNPVNGKRVILEDGSNLPCRVQPVFSQTIILPDGSKLILDKKAYLWDFSTGKLWAAPEDYDININYDLYAYRRNKFKFKKENIKVIQENFDGEDFRRMPYDLFDGIKSEEVEFLVDEGKIDKSEAEKMIITGIVGDIYKLHIGKSGREEEYLVKTSDFQYADKAKRTDKGFVVNQKDGFYLTPEGNLLYLEKFPYKKGYEIIQVVDKDKVEMLDKERIYIDYKRGGELVRHKILALRGSWYKDNNGNYKKRRLLAKRELECGFSENQDAIIYNPVLEEIQVLKAGSFFMNEVGFWDVDKYDEDKIIAKANGIIGENEYGNLVREEVLAIKGEYAINQDGTILIDGGQTVERGVFLVSKNGKYIFDFENNPLAADSKIKIINQTDNDGEFLRGTIKYINSIAVRNMDEEDEPFSMYQPEISFANWGRSQFAQTQVWTLAMYKFVARAVYKMFGRNTAYGKMTKFIDFYVPNIVFKESIPPIARCHDHWEAMKLKTALIMSYPKEKAKVLVENTTFNFLSFLKRQKGWFEGDLKLLEFESYFGVILDLVRGVYSFFTKGISKTIYWVKAAKMRFQKIKDIKKYENVISKNHFLAVIRKNIFNPFFFGIWLLLVGIISLIFPGVLSVKSPELAQFLFFFIISIIIVLPKLLMPIIGRIVDYHSKKNVLIVTLLVGAGILFGYLNMKLWPELWFSVTTGLGVIWLIYKLILSPILNFVFGKGQRCINRIIWMGVFTTVGLIIFYFIIPNWTNLFAIPSARWVPYLFLEIIPKFFVYAVPVFIFLSLTKQGKSHIRTLKRGFLEVVFSTSLFLMMIIITPLVLAKKIYFMIKYPYRSSRWSSQSSYEDEFNMISTFKTYLYLAPPVIVSIVFVILPVLTGLADFSLIFYGWPVFILSWLFGPLVAKLTADLGKDKYYNSLFYLGLRDKFIEKLPRISNDMNAIETILNLTENVNKKEYEGIKFKLYLFYLTQISESALEKNRSVIEKFMNKQESFGYRLKETEYNNLSEIARAEVLQKLSDSEIFKHSSLKLINTVKDIVLRQQISHFGITNWNDLGNKSKLNFILKISQKYGVLEKDETLKDCKYWDFIKHLF